MKKQDNKGFTLIELLVAVMVLAVIIVPLLHSFVTSYRVNAKSKQLMRATTLAQNEMEIFEKEKIEDLKAMTVAGVPSELVYTVTDQPNGCYTFERKKTINDESGREMFDVVITLDPQRTAATDRYHDRNMAELVQMNTISNLDSGSYVQSIRSAHNAADYETIVYGIFKERQKAGGMGVSWSVSDFEQKLKRKITIQVSQITDSMGPITKAKVIYEYTCEEDNVVPDEYRTYTDEKIMFDNAQTLDADGNRVELKSLYLFYAPRYDTSQVDEIIIENEAKLPIDFYVVRQDIWKKTADEVRPVEAGYQAKLTIKDAVGSEGTAGNYWTNLNLDKAEITGNGKQLELALINYDNIAQSFSKADIMDKTGLKNLGTLVVKDRIYTMTVKVYKTGANPLNEDPIVTLTGTKME